MVDAQPLVAMHRISKRFGGVHACRDVDNFITQQVDLLIISPNEAKPPTRVVKKAYGKGIPVIVVDRRAEGDAYTTWRGVDSTEIGAEAGRYVAEELLPDGGRVVELTGLPASTPARERKQGFHQAIKKNKRIKVVAQESGDWLREKGQSKMDALLKAEPDIDVVHARHDPMAEGAYLAAKASGRHNEIDVDRRRSTSWASTRCPSPPAAARPPRRAGCRPLPKTRLITKENAAKVYREEHRAG